MNIVPLNGNVLPPQVGEPRESLVVLLENILEKARSGQLQSFIGCGFTSDGMRMAAWHDTHPNVYEMLGSLAWLQHEYVHRKVEDNDGQHP